MSGWVKIHKKSLKSSIWENANYWMVWCWCLLRANYEDTKFPFNGKDMLIKRGQFLTGRRKAVKELPTSTQTYRSAIEYLKSTHRISVKTTNKFTIITVINYDLYQDKDELPTKLIKPPLTIQQPTSNQPVTTEKNIKNIKKTTTYVRSFEDFWNYYPLKKAKYKASLIWSSIKPNAELQKTIFKAVEKQKKSDDWTKDGGKYIPHPTTYLNGRRWEDEIKVKQSEEDKLWTKK